MSGERCRLCPFSDGALKRTDSGGWAHILCAQYIPEVGTDRDYIHVAIAYMFKDIV